MMQWPQPRALPTAGEPAKDLLAALSAAALGFGGFLGFRG